MLDTKKTYFLNAMRGNSYKVDKVSEEKIENEKVNRLGMYNKYQGMA